MTGHFFDVAVIAEGMNGLIAAYELSKTDVSVVLIDRYKPSLSMDGYVFNPYPQHLFSDAELPDLFRQLHGVFETYAHPAFQVILPDRRIDISADGKKTMSEIARRFKGQSSGFAAYLSGEQALVDLLRRRRQEAQAVAGAFTKSAARIRTNVQVLRERQRMHRNLAGLMDDPLPSIVFRAIIRFLFPWNNGSTPPNDMRFAPAVLRKRFYPMGGRDSLKNAILQELVRRNVNVLQDTEISRIEERKYFTVSIDHEQTVRARTLVAEPLSERTFSLLPFDVYRNVRKKFYMDNIFAGVNRSCLPELFNRVNSAVIVADYDRPLTNDNLIFLDANPISDIKRAKDEMAALTITTLIHENSISRISAIRNAVLSHVRRFMPFFDDFVENIYFTDPSVLWDNSGVPVNKRGILLLNDEFINQYTLDSKYAYISRQVKKLISNL